MKEQCDATIKYLDSMPDSIENPGAELFSPAKRLGECLRDAMQRDPHLYLFSPDETTSNKLDATYQVSARSWVMPTKPWDMPESANGRIVELLSENTLFGAMVGHVLGSKEPAFMTSYEAFFEIIAAQLIQHLKFLKQVDEATWRKKLHEDIFPAINLLSTSTCWRQDHNGFSHQSPALISTLLNVPTNYVNCLFPVDDVAATAAFDYMLSSRNVVNLTTFNKTDEPRFIDRHHAKFQFDNGGASIFGFASSGDYSLADAGPSDGPSLIFTSAGDIITRETLAAIQLLKNDLPGVNLRFVGVSALTHGAIGTTDNHFSQEQFNAYFGYHAPIISNFHGYADTFKSILANYTDGRRIFAHGFSEQGSTTTPLEMLTLNHASRFDLAAEASSLLGRPDLAEKYRQIIAENHRYAQKHGDDQMLLCYNN